MGKDERLLKRETKVLGVQNFHLCDVIAETRALQAHLERLEEEQYLLNGGGLVPQDIAMEELDDGYDQEINRLQEILATCHDQEQALAEELKNVQDELDHVETRHKEATEIFEQSKQEADNLEALATKSALEYTAVEKEVEELLATRDFRKNVCEEELDAVQDYVNNYNDAVEEYNQQTPEMQQQADYRAAAEQQRKESQYDYADIEKLLADFAENYQNLLDEAYSIEQQALAREIESLLKRRKQLNETIHDMKLRKERDLIAIDNRKAECEELERIYAEVFNARANDRKAWEKELEGMRKQIDRIKEEIAKKEKELGVLVDLDNAIVRQAYELELEIQGYKAMLNAEQYA